MDFRELLLVADQNQKKAAKESQQVKRINTHFTTPAKKDDKGGQPKSEVLQKLLEEKEKEQRRKKEAEEREKRRKEKEKEEREKEEKRKNTFRIPKKAADEDPPSDAESFSSISSDDESELQKSSTKRSSGETSHKSKSHSSDKRDKHSSSSKHSSSHSSKKVQGETSSKDSDHHRPRSDKDRKSSEKHKHSSLDKSKSDKHKHSSSEGHKHSSSDRHKHSSEKHSSSEKHKHSSEKHRSHSEKDQKSSSGTHRSHGTGGEKAHKQHVSDKSAVDNDSSGYITSPDLSSFDEEEEEEKGKGKERKAPSSKLPSNQRRRESTNAKVEESADCPVTLTRHHLKPTVERQGCTQEERDRVLAKLQAIRERMMSGDDDSSPRKRAAKGEVKKRRARREKLEGDFTGSCMEKIDYDGEEKPSLKRPEPKPEEPKPEKVKKEKKKMERSSRHDRPEKSSHTKSEERHRERHKHKHKEKHSSDKPLKVNRFDAMKEKERPKIKPRPIHRPPPVNFAELMKMAEQKQAVPVMVEVAPKKEKEKRPMTQEEIDRKRAREERLKTQEYKDWYKFGEKAVKNKEDDQTVAKDKDSGGFLHKEHNVIPPGSSSSSTQPKLSKSGQPKDQQLNSARPNSNFNSRPSASHNADHRPAPGFKPQPHPTRPGMIANKPLAMAQHLSNGQSSEAKKRPPSPDSRSQGSSRDPPSRSMDKTKSGNAWDSLFNRPEYKRMKEPPAKKGRMVIDSEEEDEDYDEDMDDFIDDEGEEDMSSVSGAIRQLFGYDRTKYRDEDYDDRNMEAKFSDVMKEEARSARLGRQEDLEDIRREEEELRQKALKKKMKR